jgi:hypothetical protein
MVRDTSASAAKYTANVRHVKAVQGFEPEYAGSAHAGGFLD